MMARSQGYVPYVQGHIHPSLPSIQQIQLPHVNTKGSGKESEELRKLQEGQKRLEARQDNTEARLVTAERAICTLDERTRKLEKKRKENDELELRVAHAKRQCAVACRAIKRCPKQLLDQAHAIKTYQQQQHKSLTQVANYLVQLNRERAIKISQKEPKNEADPTDQPQRQFMAQDALNVLNNYDCGPGIQMDFDDVDLSKLKGNLQGYNLGLYTIAWAKTLRWPMENTQGLSQNNSMVAGWGVSWFELYINFVILTQKHCPIRLSGSLADTKFIEFNSIEASLLPTADRSGMVQCTSFQSAVRCVESILQTKIVPPHIKKGGSSLHRFGFQGQIAGLSCRPMFQQQNLTVQKVYEYVTAQSNKLKLRAVVPDIPVQPSIVIEWQEEPEAKERFLEYKRIYGRRRYA